MEDGADGSVTLRLNVAVNPELQSWIKGLLPHVKVVRPPALRDAIAKDLERARESFKVPRK
jgi:predicted DNA-binding transcriptional regulator YafY